MAQWVNRLRNKIFVNPPPKLFVQGYNLEVQAIVTFGEIRTLLRIRKGMKDKGNRHDAVGKSSSE